MVFKDFLGRLFQERWAISRAYTNTRAKACDKSHGQFKLLTMLLQHNCVSDQCTYSVTIKQTSVVDYQIEVLFLSILILKAIDST